MVNAVLNVQKYGHKPVMAKEVLEFLRPTDGGVYIDATLGLGGYTEKILEHSESRAMVIGFDIDNDAISIAKNRLSRFGRNVVFVNKNFTLIDMVLEELNIQRVDGIIADLGISSYQIESSGKGLSFLRDEPLDMRMDSSLKVTAYNLINERSSEEITKILKIYGEEKWASRIARDITRIRREGPISSSLQLSNIVSNAIPKKFHPRRIHPSTKTFQALRIAVNNEIESLSIFLEKASTLLSTGARMVVISFHSLEDRVVKNAFRRFSSNCICPPDMPECGCGKKSILKVLTSSPLTPSAEEIFTNLRARSAKMRVAEGN